MILSPDAIVLIVLLISVLCGFGLTLGVLWLFDSRVFDVNGKFVPSPSSHLWGRNLRSILMEARKTPFSNMIRESVLPEIGDGNIVAVNLFGQHIAVVAHPDMVKVLLSGHHVRFTKCAILERTKFAYGEGLLTSGGSRWQTHRHMINSGFHAESLRDIVHVFGLHSRKVVMDWSARRKSALKSYETAVNTSIRIDLGTELYKLVVDITPPRDLALWPSWSS